MSFSSKSTQVVHCNIMPNISQEPLKPWSIKCQIHQIYNTPFHSAPTGQEKHCLSPKNIRILLSIGLQLTSNNPVKPLRFHLLRTWLNVRRPKEGGQVSFTQHVQARLSNPATSAALQHCSWQSTIKHALVSQESGSQSMGTTLETVTAEQAALYGR